MRILVLALVIIALSAFGVAGAEAEVCSRQDAMDAEKEASSLQSWSMLYASFQRFYPRCDDGAISEGYSETVTRILAKDWDQFGVLQHLIQTDTIFEKFVISHIDQTTSKQNLEALLSNARKQCPKGSESFCAEIIKRSISVSTQPHD